jgi:hypothetical protein
MALTMVQCLLPAQLYAGYSKWILAFDVACPGRQSFKIPCTVKGPGQYNARLSGAFCRFHFLTN